MKISAWVWVLLLTIGFAIPSVAQKEKTVANATGAFDVKVEPQGDPDKADGSTLARYSLDKQYRGDLEGTSKGTMLTAGTEVKDRRGMWRSRGSRGRCGGGVGDSSCSTVRR